MGVGKDFAALERRSAENFREACVAGGVRAVVYLGGLETKETGSEHLRSRIETVVLNDNAARLFPQIRPASAAAGATPPS